MDRDNGGNYFIGKCVRYEKCNFNGKWHNTKKERLENIISETSNNFNIQGKINFNSAKNVQSTRNI
jgi:hypothetical protein